MSLRKAIHLEYLTVAWNAAEAVIAIAAALAAGSVALFGFGLDSVVEGASGIVLLWRLQAERRGSGADVERLDRAARRLVGGTLLLLAAYIVIDSVRTLSSGDRPETSAVGVVIVSVSLGVMWWLARAKSRAARRLSSRALEADAFQTSACWWLSLFTLAGIGLNAMLGWWWADPVAALFVAGLLVPEGRRALRAEAGC